jgi:hypothetical protein
MQRISGKVFVIMSQAALMQDEEGMLRLGQAAEVNGVDL